MLSTPHLMIGAAIGAVTGSVPLAVAGGIVSHHLADMVLHTDPATFRPSDARGRRRFSRITLGVAAVDLLVGGLLVLAVARGQPHFPAMLAGSFSAILPDLMDNVPFWCSRFRATAFGRRYHAFHDRFHWTARRPQWVAGILTQLVLWLVAAWIVRGAR